MSYRLDPAMPMSEALRRVAFAELEIAHGALATPPERHSGVHSARKCLKRLRSLLLLVRPGMPEPAFATLTDRLAVIARGLAPARDAAALIDAVDKLERETGAGPGLGPIQSLRAWLHKRRHAAEQNLERSAASDAMRGLARDQANLRRPRRLSRRLPLARQGPQALLSHDPRVVPARLRRRAATRMCTNGAKACSIIGGRCNCSPRAGRRSLRRGLRPPGRCRRSSATTTTSPCSAGSCPRRP